MLMDPIEQAIRTAKELDHARAAARGARLGSLADALVAALEADGHRHFTDQDWMLIVHVAADVWYGHDRAIDLPTRRRHP